MLSDVVMGQTTNYSKRPRKAHRWQAVDHGYVTRCHIWQLAIHPRTGYGVTKFRSVSMPAHRAAYIEARGAIPAGYDIDHLCRVRACVNPDHLEAVSRTENIRRSRGTKLTLADAVEIRRLCAAGVRQREIAARFGVDQSVVSDIKNFKLWRAEP